MTPLNVLIVDDESDLRQSVVSILRNTLPEISFAVDEAANGKEAYVKVRQSSWDLVLMDVKMPEMNGIEALQAIKEHDPRTFVVLMTAHSNLSDAVVAIREGAYDYVEKPVSPQRLVEIIRKSLEAREMVSSLAFSNPIFDDDIDSEFVGSSKKMREIFDLIYKLCKVDTTVLIRGENGTGKELVAKAIHFNSPRKKGPFVAINCGAIPENLIESELFGHEKGAFTGAFERKIGRFQLANNGTLFLDEIAELRPEMQVKLLRVLQERKFVPVGSNRELKTTTRILAATNRNLERMIQESTFREDLFYRLNVMPIFLPPLRDRTDDIEALTTHFIKKFSKQHGNSISSVAPTALTAMKQYRWPGNIRELENVIERAFIIESTPVIHLTSLPEQFQLKHGAGTGGNLQGSGVGFGNGIGGSGPGGSGAGGSGIGGSGLPAGRSGDSGTAGISTGTLAGSLPGSLSGTLSGSSTLTQQGGPFNQPSGTSLHSLHHGVLNFDSFKEQAERDFIVSALKMNKGKINQTVAHANIPKNTLLRKIKKYGINVKDFVE